MGTSLEYLAGFFDGEGSIQIQIKYRKPTKTPYYNLRISVGQIDKRPLELFKDRFGGFFSKQEANGKTYHHWNAESKKAQAALIWLLPYLLVKKEEAVLAIEFEQLRFKRGKAFSDSERATMIGYREKISSLKQRTG